MIEKGCEKRVIKRLKERAERERGRNKGEEI